jgi:hypothetical protein
MTTTAPADAFATAILATAPTAKGARTDILYGQGFRTTPHARGLLHWFHAERLVAYRSQGQRACTFLFRTLPLGAAGGTRIAGVDKPVRLLLQTTTTRQSALLASLLRRLLRNRREPAALPDLFYLRLQGVLSRRSAREGAVLALLACHDNEPRR